MNGPTAEIRAPVEIQRMHDLITRLVLCNPVVRDAVPDTDLEVLMHYANVLCWVLGHDHNRGFENNMHLLETRLLLIFGCELEDLGEVHYPAAKEPVAEEEED